MSGFDRVDLRHLLEQDGHTLKKESGHEFVTFCPFHDDRKRPNLSVNLAKQLYICRSCGEKGDAVSYLVKVRGMTMRQALEARDGKREPGEGQHQERRPRPEPEPEKPRYIDKLPEKHDGEWRYRSADGTLRYVVQRYDKGPHPNKPGKMEKRFGQYSPVQIRQKDGSTKKAWQIGLRMKHDRPLLYLPGILKQMAESPERGVVVVEGETCCDLMREAMPKAIVTTCSGGSQAYHYADWTPLMGRNVVIFADADEGGHKAARWLADLLGPHCPNVAMILPGEDSPYPDCGDAVEAGGAKAVQAWMKGYMVRWEPPAPPEEPPGPEEPPPHEEEPGGPPAKTPPPAPPEGDDLGENQYFTLLGNTGDRVLIKLRDNTVTTVTRASLMQPPVLASLAPDLNWWRAILQVDSMSRPAAMVAGTGLLRIADSIGQIDMTTMVDRGVTRNLAGETVWNLGNRLLVDGAERDMNYRDGNLYTAGPAIIVGEASRPALDLDARARIAETLLRYRWADQDDGKRMLGWLATAMCGGLLDWRPHLWMLGPKDIGKSWFIKTVAMRIHASMAIRTSDATPAAIARRMGGASTPLYVDEAEPSRWWVGDVVTLCRIASGADGERLRAEAAGGGFSSQEPRFSACMSSTKMPAMEDADNSRFTLIRFSTTGVDDWPKLKAEIERIFSPPSTTPQDLRHALVLEAGEIADEARRLTAQLEGEGRAARDSMISAALTAGWRWWTGDDEVIYNRTPLRSEPEGDARNVLMEILGHRIRTRSGEDRALLDFIASEDDNSELLGSYGLKVMAEGLAILPNHPGFERILSRGRAKGADLRSLLAQIEGIRSIAPMRIGGMRNRPMVVPASTLEEMGVDWTSTLPV